MDGKEGINFSTAKTSEKCGLRGMKYDIKRSSKPRI
jgi:hypothetical protein